MDIYSIGTEKCIDGVWGRELDGRFYTHYETSAVVANVALSLCRRLDVSSIDSHWAVRGVQLGYPLRQEAVDSSPRTTKYTPKHIKDLENLKRGDVVWVRLQNSNLGVYYASTRFISKCREGFITCDLFRPDGTVNLLHTVVHSEVFLKPPFDI